MWGIYVTASWLRKPVKIQKNYIKLIKVSKNKAKIVGENGKRIFTITRLYDNYDAFLKSMKTVVKNK